MRFILDYMRLILLLLATSAVPLHAFQVHTTYLSGERYPSVPHSRCLVFEQRLDIINEVQTDVATITLNFLPGEMGQDYEGANTLAQKEAEKVGADRGWRVSSTEYSDTSEIASVTYHLTRTEYENRAHAGDAFWEEAAKTNFGARYRELHDFIFSGRVNEALGLKALNGPTRCDAGLCSYRDTKSGKTVTDDERYSRLRNYAPPQFIAFLKDNAKDYAADRARLLELASKTKVGEGTLLLLPQVDTGLRIDESPILRRFGNPKKAGDKLQNGSIPRSGTPL